MNIPQNTVSDTWGSSRQGEAVEAEDSEMLKQNRDSSDNWSKQTAIQSKGVYVRMHVHGMLSKY